MTASVSLVTAMLVVSVVVVAGAPPPPRRPDPGVGVGRRRWWRRPVVAVVERVGPRVEAALVRAELAGPGGVRRVLDVWWVFGAIVIVAGSLVGGVAGAVAGLVGAVAGPPLLVVARGDRHRRRVVAALPEFCDLVARSLRSGSSLRTAIAEAGAGVEPLTDSVAVLVARAEAGSGLEEALAVWSDTLAHPDAELVATVLALGRSSGAAVARPLEQAAGTLRERRELADEIAALTSQTRSSAVVVAVAPLAFAVLVSRTDARMAAVFTGTAVGRVCLVAGLVLDAAGVWWMRRLTRSDRPRSWGTAGPGARA